MVLQSRLPYSTSFACRLTVVLGLMVLGLMVLGLMGLVLSGCPGEDTVVEAPTRDVAGDTPTGGPVQFIESDVTPLPDAGAAPSDAPSSTDVSTGATLDSGIKPPDTKPAPDPGTAEPDTSSCACPAGESISEACGLCGTRVCNCGANCFVGACGDCLGEGPCAPGEVDKQTQPCGCGQQERSRTCLDGCVWGDWSDWTDCGGGGVCSPGDVQTDATECGNCGSKTRTRLCTGACEWGSWGPYGSCGGEGACAAGEKQSQTESCGNCGSRKRSRTCSATCKWGSWGSWGSCGGQGACAPGQTAASDCEECTVKTCSGSCQWGSCKLKAGAECKWEKGTNWKCCGGGKWHFCLPPSSGCIWSPQCASCTGCGC